MSSDEEESAPKAPLHVLLLPREEQQQILNHDPRLDNDYLARRYKCIRKSREGKPKTDPDEHDDEQDDDAFWSGASPLERALVECCDVEDEESGIQGGAISRGKQAEFVGLMAGHCHTTVSQALVIAILERTLERDRIAQEEYEEQEEEEEAEVEEESKDDGGDESTENKKTEDSVSAASPDVDASPAQEQLDKKSEPPEDMETTPENALSKEEGGGTDAAETNAAMNEEEEEMSEEEDDDDDLDRISPLLAAGGLMILGQWLVDSTTPVTTGVPKSSNNKKRKSSPSPDNDDVETIASPTGPIVLPLLAVLEEIPFHKKLVTKTKINKQIRNLKKQLDEAIASFKRRTKKRNKDAKQVDTKAEASSSSSSSEVVLRIQGIVDSLMQQVEEHANQDALPPEAKKQLENAVALYGDGQGKKPSSGQTLQEWRDPVAGGNIVVQVQQAVASLMSSWQEKAKRKDAMIPEPKDPFDPLRERIRQGLDVVKRYQAGEIPEPDWLARIEELDISSYDIPEIPTTTDITSEPPTSPSRLTTQQLGANERRQEREKLREAMQKTQKEKNEAKKKLEELRKKIQEQNIKRSAEKQQPAPKRARVKWRDGGLSNSERKRKHLLEEVFEYPTNNGQVEMDWSDTENGDTEENMWGDDDDGEDTDVKDVTGAKLEGDFGENESSLL